MDIQLQSTVNVSFGDYNRPSFKDIDFDSEFLLVQLVIEFFKVTGSISGLTSPDKLAIRSWDITVPQAGGTLKMFPQFNQLGNTLTLIVSASAVANATGSYSVDYRTTNRRW